MANMSPAEKMKRYRECLKQSENYEAAKIKDARRKKHARALKKTTMTPKDMRKQRKYDRERKRVYR